MSSTVVADNIPASRQGARPDPPGWLARLTDRVRRLPFPSWLFYLLVGLTCVLVFSAIKWSLGLYPAGTFQWLHVVAGAGAIDFVALIHYLDNTTHTWPNCSTQASSLSFRAQ